MGCIIQLKDWRLPKKAKKPKVVHCDEALERTLTTNKSVTLYSSYH